MRLEQVEPVDPEGRERRCPTCDRAVLGVAELTAAVAAGRCVAFERARLGDAAPEDAG